MALDVDGYAVLGAIARAPDAFPDLRAELAKTARTLVVKQLKAKGLTLDGLRRVHGSLGAEPFALVVDGLTEAEARSLVTRVDKHYPDAKTAPLDALRRHLAALAGGAEPTGKPAGKPPKPKDPEAGKPLARAPKVTRALGSPAFAASWDGKDHDVRDPEGKEGAKDGAKEGAKPAKAAKSAKPAKSKK